MSRKLSPHVRRSGDLMLDLHRLGMPSKTPYFVLLAFDDLLLFQYKLTEVDFSLLRASKCGRFQSFSFIYIVRITRFPRESLTDFTLFES